MIHTCMIDYISCYFIGEEHGPVIVSVIREVNEWEELGIQLGIKYTVIEQIKRDNFYQVTTSRMNMILTWLQGGNATSDGLLTALKTIGKNNIVFELHKIIN